MKSRKDKTYKISDLVFAFLIAGWILFGWTYTYDTDTPVGTDAPSVIDDRIREVKDGVQERQNIDHYWPLTGSQVSDDDAGKHRQVTFYTPLAADPTSVDADEGQLYTKDVSSAAELFWIDESEGAIQLTSGGYLLGSSLLDGSLLTADIADANVTNAKLADDSVDSNDIVSGAIDSRHFSAGAVMTDDIADANITAAKIANLDPDAVGSGTRSVTYANGFIFNWGEESIAVYATDDVTYDTAVTGVLSMSCTVKETGVSQNEVCTIKSKSGSETTTAQIKNNTSNAVTVYWQVWGY